VITGRLKIVALLLAGTLPAAFPACDGAQPAHANGCASDPAFHALDFWIGTWRVTSGRQFAGTDVVTSELAGCAVVEKWSDADGSRGQSLFVYDTFSGRWQQTWVTDAATHVGGLKYKTLVARYPGGGVRFQGVLPAPSGKPPILDRTTLTPVADGTVHQVIEISRDGGSTWTTTFDATYAHADGS
jgi:hypothetical protein